MRSTIFVLALSTPFAHAAGQRLVCSGPADVVQATYHYTTVPPSHSDVVVYLPQRNGSVKAFHSQLDMYADHIVKVPDGRRFMISLSEDHGSCKIEEF